MRPTKADAIQFLKDSIARYRQQLETLHPSGRGAGNVIDFPQPGIDREHLHGLIDDARSLLSQLRAS